MMSNYKPLSPYITREEALRMVLSALRIYHEATSDRPVPLREWDGVERRMLLGDDIGG